MTRTYQNTRNQSREIQTPALIAYHVTERGEQSYWTRIGAAWGHEDAKGMTVQLDLIPANGGRIVLREAGQEPENNEG